jgi:hypothetical protein
MSSVAITGNAAGAGVFTLASPNSASSFTATLPTATTTLVGTDATQTLTNKTIQGGAITSGTAVASTSGTSIDFTSLPTWVKRITVMFNGVSTSGTSIVQVQFGTGSTTYTTTGYTSSAASISGAPGTGTLTSGFGLEWSTAATAASTRYGQIIISNVSSNIWVASGSCYTNSTYQTVFSGGVSLAAALTAVRITTVNGTDTFDAGSINILYEG